MWCVLCVLEVVVCRVKKPGGARFSSVNGQASSKRALVRFLYFASFVLNRMPIAGDKLPAFLRRIVPGERGGVLCSYHLFKHTMDYHPIYICLSHACSSKAVALYSTVQYGAPFFAPRPLSSLRCLRLSPRITRECFCSYGGC